MSDDAAAFFTASGDFRDSYFTDAFARGILRASRPDVVLVNSTLVRCPVPKSEDHRLPENQG